MCHDFRDTFLFNLLLISHNTIHLATLLLNKNNFENNKRMQLKNKLTLSMLSALFFLSCSKKEIQYEDPLLTNRDTTVNPGDDFFHYANGGWFAKHPIPSTESSNGIFRTYFIILSNIKRKRRTSSYRMKITNSIH